MTVDQLGGVAVMAKRVDWQWQAGKLSGHLDRLRQRKSLAAAGSSLLEEVKRTMSHRCNSHMFNTKL
ncbi:hypothetical protein NQZ68_027842 [Dissostichus eleginoides]|nr:hypothetical protein NQZ68_027842 [Dissostichus eleginoides]